MSVIKRGDSKYWYVQFQYNGRTYIKSSKSTEKKVAELLEANWKRDLATQGIFGTKSRISFKEALSLYTKSKESLASIRNITRYAEALSHFFEDRRFLDEIATGDLERLRTHLTNQGYSPQTTKHILGTMRGTWRYAKRLGYQVSELEFPAIKVSNGKLRYLSFDEERKLLAAIDPERSVKGLPSYRDRTELMRREMHDLRDFIVILLDTGARHSEISGLKWSQVNLKQGTIALWRPKVRNESVLYMTDRVRKVLELRNGERTGLFVFMNRTGGARSYIGTTLRRAFTRAGLPDCSLHTLRHTHATRLIQHGLSIYEVKEILGHSDIKTTMRYAHIEQTAASKKARELINRLNLRSSSLQRK